MPRIEPVNRPWITKTETKRNLEHDKFYDSPAWRKLSKLKRRLDPLCEASKSKGIIAAAEMTDHIRPKRLYPELSLDMSNLMSLTNSIHAKKSQMEGQIQTRDQWERKFVNKEMVIKMIV